MVVFVFSVISTKAAIRRVGAGLNVPGVDYGDFQSAQDNALNGDTILLFPSLSVRFVNLSKRLVVLGYGYFTDTLILGTGANPGLQNLKGPVSVDILLRTGSDSSHFEGIDGFFLRNYTGGIFGSNYDTKNITVARCNGSINFSSMVHNNLKIIQSVIDFTCTGSLANCLISNNILNSFETSSASGQSIMLLNNIFTGNWNDGNIPCIYKNNVFLWESPFAFEAGSTYQNNIFVTSVTGSKGQNNKFNVNKDAIFFGYSNQGNLSNDSRWTLRTNSPAKGAGENGIDCGIFAVGSLYPYKLSGIPSIPAFYRLDAPSSTTGSNPYNITFSVRSNN